jgi:hypothetical protein
MDFLPPYMYIVVASFITSLTVYYKPKLSSFYLKLFPPFLFLTVIVEVIGAYLMYVRQNNLTIYNFFTTFEFCFYLAIISMIIINKRVKQIIRITIVLYALAAVTNIVFIQTMKQFHTVTYSLGCLLVVAFCVYYFLELFRFPRSIKLFNMPAFWICTGLLFFYCCTFPLYGLNNYWMTSGISKLVLQNFTKIISILNVFLYSLFTIAFLCIRTRKYTLSQSSV